MLKIEDTADGIRCIGLNRPDKRNAIGVEMTLALEEVLLKTKVDASVKTIVFHGLGGHFCAGMDLKDFFDNSSRDADTLRRARAVTEEWRCHLIRNLPQRLFVAIEGYCLGAAMPIVQSAQHVVAHQNARFGLPELNFGFVPGGQIIKSVALAMPPKAVSYLALTGKLIEAAQAHRWGLVHDVVESDPLEHALMRAKQWADEAH